MDSKEVMFCLFLLFMASLCCCDVAEAKQGSMSIVAQKFEVQKHLNRLNKPAVKSIKVKLLHSMCNFLLNLFCVFLCNLMVCFGKIN